MTQKPINEQPEKLEVVNNMSITHHELVVITSKWLKHHKKNILIPNCSLIASEIVTANSTGETPDVLGWCYWTSILIEVKVNRSDFTQDKKKKFRINTELGMGEFRYYCCPSGLIKETEVPLNWGLLTYLNGEIIITKKAERVDSNLREERTMLLSLHRRQALTALEQSTPERSELPDPKEEQKPDILDVYKEWCGKSHIENACHPVHDSEETIEFAKYFSALKDTRIRELERENSNLNHLLFDKYQEFSKKTQNNED